MCSDNYPQIRCISCNKVLMEGEIIEGVIKKKCRCGVTNTIRADKNKPAGQVTGIPYEERLKTIKHRRAIRT